jgi:hypothetical protein
MRFPWLLNWGLRTSCLLPHTRLHGVITIKVCILIMTLVRRYLIGILVRRQNSKFMFGRAMTQAVTRQPLISEARVCAQVSPCGIYGGQFGTGTGFSPNSLLLPCQYRSAVALHTHMESQWGVCEECWNVIMQMLSSLSLYSSRFWTTFVV